MWQQILAGLNFCAGVICSVKGLMLETSAFESLDGGQFTLSTQLIKPNYFEFLQIHWFTTDPAIKKMLFI